MTPTTGLPDAPRRVTPDDTGATFALALGTTATLVLRDPAAPEPQAEGSSVLVIQIVNVQNSGVREWELRAVAPGTTVVRGGTAYEITLVVP